MFNPLIFSQITRKDMLVKYGFQQVVLGLEFHNFDKHFSFEKIKLLLLMTEPKD